MDAVEIQASGLGTGVPERLHETLERVLSAGAIQTTLPLEDAFDY